MTQKQKAALIAPPLLLATMIPVYELLAHLLGKELGWYAGFLVYWPFWCLAFPLWSIGWSRLQARFRSTPLSPWTGWVVALPVALALVGRLVSASGSTRPLLWFVTALVNGVLEEVLWRGLYSELFPSDVRWGVLWPGLWFGLWHIAPGRISVGAEVWLLVTSATGLGLAFGWVAHHTGSIRWTSISHVLAGVIQT